MLFKYPEVFSKLTYETAYLIFLKKDGSIRLMLATRNLSTVALRWGFQGKALVSIEYMGIVDSIERLNEVADSFLKFKEEYEKTQPMTMTMDMLD